MRDGEQQGGGRGRAVTDDHGVGDACRIEHRERVLRRHMLAEGFPASRVGVITNGIDVGDLPGETERIKARAELLIPPDAVLFGTAGRFEGICMASIAAPCP